MIHSKTWAQFKWAAKNEVQFPSDSFSQRLKKNIKRIKH